MNITPGCPTIGFSRFKTHCCRGHALEGENLTWKAGVKQCRACNNFRAREATRRNKTGEAAPGHVRPERCKRGHDFTPDNTYVNRSGGRACKTCKCLAKRVARANKIPRVAAEDRRVNLKRYGLTPALYDEMLLRQGGVCAICHKPVSNNRRKHLDVDHDHSTGVVRGLLCCNCNRGIGLFTDSPRKLMAAASYLLLTATKEGAS